MMMINEVATTVETLDDLVNQDYQRALSAFYTTALEYQLPLALWRFPHDEAQHALVDFNGVAQQKQIDFTEKVPGFTFAPFLNPGGQETLFIRAGLYLSPGGHHSYDQRSPYDNPFERNNRGRFLKTYRELLAREADLTSPCWVTSQIQPHLCDEPEYCRLVQTAIDYMNSTGIKKVVTSRATETTLPRHFNPLTTFDALCHRYPHAFVSLVSIPGVGTWIGASPEVLLRLKADEAYTVALAGTQPRPNDIPLSAVKWGGKEIEEQALVSDYIRDFFHQERLINFAEIGPQTVSAGQMLHLQTQFKIRLAEPALSALANKILHQLHPTSAVCGMPKREALAFLLTQENYDRAFYSGFLGPVHLNHQSNLFVNLRCMQLKEKSAILYIGGGLTPDSDPQAEWTETVLKSKTLLNVLQQN